MTHQVLKGNLKVLDRTLPSRSQGTAWYQQLDIQAIAHRYSTPLYITNQARIVQNLRAYQDLLGETKNVYFPVKVNPCLATFKLLAKLGCSADCASRREVQLARLAGVPETQLSYYSPALDLNLAITLLSNGGSVVIDSPSALRALSDHLEGKDFPGKLLLRVNPPLYHSYRGTADYQKHTAHGHESSQFGLPSEEVIPFLNSTTLPFSGLHIHVGTQMDNVEVFQESLEALHELCDVIHAITPHRIVELNLGGGLGVAAHAGERFPLISDLAKALQDRFRPELTYKMEPGNALFGDATVLLTQVMTRKSSRGKGWAIVNVGTDQLLKVTLAGFAQEILRADGTPLPRSGMDSIAGPLCFAGDILLPETDLSGIEEGDVLLLPKVGAYCRSIGNRFNGQTEPAMLMVDEDQELGLVYGPEDPYWQPVIQSFQPAALEELPGEAKPFTPEQFNQLRSVYLHQECSQDRYTFHECIRVAPGQYEMSIEVHSSVAFISAPTVMRIISDAAVAVIIDSLGCEEKTISVWGSRFNVSLKSLLRSKRRHRLRIHLTERTQSPHSKNQELIAYWQLGEGAGSGNILALV
ncbi:diaminopimelate decarboxylase family protein [Lyngbya confervoides]|uniref:Orn/DAP/Arg decarboxylase 2 N-terminal domain-containing protein n=1 Tax=Lyngbya confervoides BDU141951 TaxID=1574623 RepID=A0ABD4SZQ0_9CYAN|nr:pyridoxal-dependent decarboxylase, pyridoxal binding domain protein [Lyngbya confervoides]MCM1981864.1 hypothetical protein [Lyngbya confervoides BDU141951]